MIEPTVQDFIRACTELSLDAFRKQVPAPVLVAKTRRSDQTFQLAPTHMNFSEKKGSAGQSLRRIQHQMPVLELSQLVTAEQAQLKIGRSEDNDIVIHDETVSQEHALFYIDPRGDLIMLQDLESTNGTTINGNLLVPGRAVELRDTDVIYFGDTGYVYFSPDGFYQQLKKMSALVSD